MPLNNVIRDKQFFQDLRDSNIAIRADDFDNQFNQIVNYINANLITYINGLTGGAGVGIVGQPNTFLRNIGDGTTDWATVNSDAFQDYTIEFSKIAQAAAPCTILASGQNQAFAEVSSNITNEVLISRNNDLPTWSKVRTDHVDNRGITGLKIGLQVIANEHLQPGILINNLANNSLLNRNFINNAVTRPKLSLGQLNTDNLGIIPLTGYNVNFFTIRLNKVKLGVITSDKISNANAIYPQHFNRVKCIIAGKLAPSSITDGRLSFSNQADQVVVMQSSVLSPNFKLTGRELALDTFIKTMFEPTAEQAFTNKGC